MYTNMMNSSRGVNTELINGFTVTNLDMTNLLFSVIEFSVIGSEQQQ